MRTVRHIGEGKRGTAAESDGRDPSYSRSHLLTVVLEDYFHVAPLKGVVQSEHWYRFDRRVESNTHKALQLLDEFDISATFFVLGSIADEMPELVREVVDRGHEVASKGYFHQNIQNFDREEFRDDLNRSREALERASGRRVNGYRIGHRWFGPQDLWALDVLAEAGFRYDSSVRPLFRRYSSEPWRRLPFQHSFNGASLWEFPLASWTFAGWSVPISGGNYFRQLPHWMVRRAVSAWINECDDPFLMYFHVWELDPDQPRISAAPLRERIRQYRNLDKMIDIVRYYLDSYPFCGIADHLGIDRSLQPTNPQPPKIEEGIPVVRFERERTPVTIVIPCYNEELILPYLANTLRNVRQTLGSRYELSFVFVDDASQDGTWRAINDLFGGRTDCSFRRHDKNKGVASAILTGLEAAETEIVCSIDCDCTYDPHQLQHLIPMLTDEVDLVTASPYHPDGAVVNVPQWRLFLSRKCSALYRIVLHTKLATYTSCFRVYRKTSMAGISVGEQGFLGVAEMLGKLDLRGGTIIEYPAVLEVRLLGRSKMKTVYTIFGHLGLLSRFVTVRVRKAVGISDYDKW